MSNVFEKWNKNVNTSFTDEIDQLDKGEGNYSDVPVGEYEVKISKMELKASKKGDPMFVCQFKVLTGSQKGQMIFMNQIIPQPFQIHIVNEFLRSLDSGLEIKFKDYSQYSDLIMDVAEEISSQKLEYALNYAQDGDYKKFTITAVFEKE